MKNICIGENRAAKFYLDPEITSFQGSSQIFLYTLEAIPKFHGYFTLSKRDSNLSLSRGRHVVSVI